jgi:hypothetical protein
MISHVVNDSNENFSEFSLNEFQLTELEARLEMVVVNFQASEELSICCRCVQIGGCGQ